MAESIMSTNSVSKSTQDLPMGEYAPARPTDVRSPCPMVNCLANHGYLPRDGRGMTPEDLKRGFRESGFSWLLGFAATKVIFSDSRDLDNQKASTSFFGKLLAKLTKPFQFILKFALHPPGQIQAKTGKKYIDINQLGDVGGIEHDISLSRHDRAQGDNLSGQPELIAKLLESSTDGGKTISIADIAAYRKRRITEQKEINPKAVYGTLQHKLACGEISLLMNCIGDGEKVRTDYAKAFFEEERLPYKEGWAPKTGWLRVGILKVTKVSRAAKNLIGLNL